MSMRVWLINVHVSVRLARRQAGKQALRDDKSYSIVSHLTDVLEDLNNEFSLTAEELAEVKRILEMHWGAKKQN